MSNVANQQDFNNWRLKLANGTENHKYRRKENDGNSNHRESSLEQLHHGCRDVKNKTQRFRLPSIHATKSTGERDSPASHFKPGNLKSKSRKIFDEQASLQTTQVRQITPAGFRQFWKQYKPSLAIQSSPIFHDIDAFSIEVIRQHNEPCVVLPTLPNENK